MSLASVETVIRLPYGLITSTVIALLCSLLGVTAVQAKPGDLDTTFGADGKVTTQIGDSDDRAECVVALPDGRLVAVGSSRNGTGYDFALVRYNSDGSLDQSFGTNGKVTTKIGASGYDIAESAALLPDGRLIVVGSSHNGVDSDFALVRYKIDGSLDQSFGANGKVTTPVGSKGDGAKTVVLLPDGRLVAAGYSSNGPSNDFALVRYNSDGSLDQSFGTNGKVVTAVGNSDDSAASVVALPDGRVVAAGSSTKGSDDFALVRYNSDGSLDQSFGTNGKVVTAVSNGFDSAESVAVLPDGRLVVAGPAFNGTGYDFALVRYNTDGSLDPTFGVSGKALTPVGNGNDGAKTVALLSDGRLIVAGYSSNGPDRAFALARYNSDGSLDPTFGVEGKAVTAVADTVTTKDDRIESVAVLSDGRLVAAGYTLNSTEYDFALVRYKGNDLLPVAPISGTSTPVGRLAIGSKRVSVSSRGRFTVKVICPVSAKQRCSGELQLTARLGKKTGSTRRSLSIAKKRFTAVPGRRAGVKLKLTMSALKALRSKKRLTATAVAVTKTASVASSSAQTRVELAYKKRYR